MPDTSLADTRLPPEPSSSTKAATRSPQRYLPVLLIIAFLFGLFTGYAFWGRGSAQGAAPAANSARGPEKSSQHSGEMAALVEQVNPAEGYTLPVRYGDLGPRLVEAGVIDFDAFTTLYEGDGAPLSQAELDVLQQGSDGQVTINAQNARFLLNFFWAVGLANKNPILLTGPIVANSQGQIERYASTGGWGLAVRPVTEIYASLDLINLTPEQQNRVEEVAAAVYRPCCDNPTIFPDCNHGMAMLGLLELMASQGASTDEMFTAAKYVNAFWFPEQTVEAALYLKTSRNIEYADADARLVTGKELSSGSGARAVHQSLQAGGLLQQSPSGGSGCTN